MVLVVAGASELQNNDNQHDDLLKRLLQDLSVKKSRTARQRYHRAKKNALYERDVDVKTDSRITLIKKDKALTLTVMKYTNV